MFLLKTAYILKQRKYYLDTNQFYFIVIFSIEIRKDCIAIL